MKELLLLLAGWILGIFSGFIRDWLGENRKKRSVATALLTEITGYNEDLEEELSILRDEAMPSMISPLYKVTYTMDFYSSLKNEICLLNPQVIHDLARYYNVIRIIENDKELIREQIRNTTFNSNQIRDFFDSQITLREEIVEFSSELISELAEESTYIPKLEKLITGLMGGERKMAKGTVIYRAMFCVFIGVLIGLLIGKFIYNRHEEAFEFISVGGKPSVVLKVNKQTGEAWSLKLEKWHKVTEEDREQSPDIDIYP